MCGHHDSNQTSVAYGSLTCCRQSTFVQDQVCTPINIDVNTVDQISQVIYVNNINPARLYATGYINISAAPDNRTITVYFLLGGLTGTIVEQDTIIPGTALSFTKSGFDTIQIAIAAGTDITPNVSGEFCITVRYPVV